MALRSFCYSWDWIGFPWVHYQDLVHPDSIWCSSLFRVSWCHWKARNRIYCDSRWWWIETSGDDTPSRQAWWLFPWGPLPLDECRQFRCPWIGSSCSSYLRHSQSREGSGCSPIRSALRRLWARSSPLQWSRLSICSSHLTEWRCRDSTRCAGPWHHLESRIQARTFLLRCWWLRQSCSWYRFWIRRYLSWICHRPQWISKWHFSAIFAIFKHKKGLIIESDLF